MLNDGGCCSHHLKNCSIQPKATSSECSQKSHSVRFLENQTIIMYCCRCRPCTAISAIEAVKKKLSERDGMSYSLLFRGWNALLILFIFRTESTAWSLIMNKNTALTFTKLSFIIIIIFNVHSSQFLMFSVHSSVFNVLLNCFLNIAVNLLVKQMYDLWQITLRNFKCIFCSTVLLINFNTEQLNTVKLGDIYIYISKTIICMKIVWKLLLAVKRPTTAVWARGANQTDQFFNRCDCPNPATSHPASLSMYSL